MLCILGKGREARSEQKKAKIKAVYYYVYKSSSNPVGVKTKGMSAPLVSPLLKVPSITVRSSRVAGRPAGLVLDINL